MAVDCYYSYNQTEHKVEEEDEEDYIDMEVSSFAHFFSLSKNTPLCLPQQQQQQQQHQHNREFEFQMSSSSMDVLEKQESTTSPADELFYMGKLLPLHLPPRLQMVEKLLQDSTPKMFSHYRANNNNVDEFYSTPFDTNAGTTPASGHTPFESCDASPVDSCQVSRELNPEEYFRSACASNEGDDHQKPFHDSNSNSNSNSNAKKSWTKKLKTKIKSLFGKSSSDHQEVVALTLTLTSPSVSSGLPVKTKDEGGDSENENKEMELVVTRDNKEVKEAKICHRRSFSGALFKRRPSSTANKLSSISSSSSAAAGLSTSSSSSSFSSSSTSTSNSNGLKELLKRSSSASSEIETSLIQGAIAHCKRSSQPEAMIQSRKTLSEVGCHSFPSSRFASIDHDHDSSLCRGCCKMGRHLIFDHHNFKLQPQLLF